MFEVSEMARSSLLVLGTMIEFGILENSLALARQALSPQSSLHGHGLSELSDRFLVLDFHQVILVLCGLLDGLQLGLGWSNFLLS